VNIPAVATDPETLLANGQLDEALRALSANVRSQPSDAALRVFLFQLLALLGEWERASNQLKVAGDLDKQNALMVSAYGIALDGERERDAVIAGHANLKVMGEPALWHAQMAQSLAALCRCDIAQAVELRAKTFDAAETVVGTINGDPFTWIADADPRFGPCLEMILKTGYAWVPFSQFRSLTFEAPTDLRDKIWAPVRIVWQDGAEAVGFVPCRYPNNEIAGDAGLALAARTEWVAQSNDCFIGRGQRMFITDTTEYSLLDVRSMTFGAC
jgi:type VI secretion system protein ImpE